MTEYELIATSGFGLEAVVVRQLKALGYEGKAEQNGRVVFAGDELAICRANLWLRSAERVMVKVGQFKAMDFGELYDQTFELPWERWIGKDGAFPVNGKSIKSQLSSVPACQKIVKKSIVDKLLKAHGTQTLPETGAKYTVEVALLKDVVTLTLDTSGAGLHKRGYRKLSGVAPLKETLASALVELSFWKPGRPLIDPFCGTGTIPIEAAMIGMNMAPGINREFAAEDWPGIGVRLWEDARDEAMDVAKHELDGQVIGTDIDGDVLSMARYHAKRAGVEGKVHFQERAFADLRGKRDYGVVICNPPYGERLSDSWDVEELYLTMPKVFAGLETWSHYVLTSNETFERIVGQKADRRRKLYNGRIACTYYQFYGPRPARGEFDKGGGREDESVAGGSPSPQPSPAPEMGRGGGENLPSPQPSPGGRGGTPPEVKAKPAFGGLPDRAEQQAELFGNRLSKMARHRRKWPSKRGISCYRIYERDVPEIPLVVDIYEGRLHVSEHDRPHDHTGSEHEVWLELMMHKAAEVMGIDRGDVYLKQRGRQRGLSQYERVGDEGKIFTVNEGDLKFEVNLSDYIDTGLFLDHRQTRQMVCDEAGGKRFLNLFAYTGAFTAYAAEGGADSTTTVDMSNTYLDWAKRNMKLNDLDGGEHRFVRNDAMAFLDEEVGKGEGQYDLAVVDPPTFSNSKKTEEDFDVLQDHVDLLTMVGKLMSSGGVVYFSNNFRRFKLDEENLNHDDQWQEIVEISDKTVPEDFRNKRIHRCWRMVKG